MGPVTERAKRLFGGQVAHGLGAVTEDGLPGEELVVLEAAGQHGVADDRNVVPPSVGQVGRHATGTDVVVVHPEPGRLLEEAQHHLALAEAVDHHGRRAEVHAVGGHPHEVGRHPLQLGHEHADPHRPRRELHSQELLGGHGEDQLVGEGREVVHAGHVGGALDVGELLTGLLHAGVQVPDDRLGAQHGLAVELQHQAQHPVRRGVLRAHVDDHRVVVAPFDVDVVGVDEVPLGQPEDGADLPAQLSRARRAAIEQLLSALGGLRRAHRGPGASLNCTGTRPTP